MNKKILIAIHRFEVGGAETQALYLAKYLKENGFEVIVGAFGDEKGFGFDRFVQEGLKTVYWGFQERLILSPEPGKKAKLIGFKYLIRLIRNVRSLSPDVIIPYTYPPNVIFGRYKRWFKRTKIFWNQRDINIGFIGHPWEKIALKNADIILSNSISGAKFLEGIAKRKVDFVPNFVDVDRFKISDSSFKSKELKFVMVGNIHANKNHIKLLNDWIYVLKIKPNAKLYLAGKLGNEYEKCAEFVQDNNLGASVVFLGQVIDIVDLFQKSHIALFYSHGEGMPNGILEPMAAGLPVLVHRRIWSEVILGEDYPCFIDDDDKESLASSLLRLQNEGLKKIGDNNRKRVEEKFGESISLKPYFDYINA